MSDSIACRVCGGTEGNTVYVARERMQGTADEFDYVRCATCGCQQIVEVPQDLGKYYPTDYYSYSDQQSGGLRKTVTNMRDRSYFEWTIPAIAGRLVAAALPNPKLASIARIRPRREARILDVGCGNGELLNELRSIGYTRLSGVDPFVPSDLDLPGGVRVRKISMEELGDETYDVIMLHHAFEHLPDPLGSMKSIARLLADDGVCIIRIPVAHSWASQHYGPLWMQHDAPRHLFLHTEKSMARAAAQAGLEIVETVYDSSEAQIWGSELYKQNISLLSVPRGVYGNPIRRLLSPKFIRYRAFTRRLNREGLGDQAAFYLRRSS
ncbi:MAG: class I SAM-dependent methyltransferase [Gemmatimonadales bacterium]